MKLVVFGATGATGKQVVEQALQAGHKVTAMVRTPSAVSLRHPKLTVVQGDVLQRFGFETALQGANAVVSCLGVSKPQPTTVYSEGINNISQAMHKAGIMRLICLSSVGVVVPPRASWFVKLLTKYVLRPWLKDTYDDMSRMEDLLTKSDLNWTVIRPPRLVDTKHTGHYRTTINKPIEDPSKISRSDLADYILTHLTDEKTAKAIVEISY